MTTSALSTDLYELNMVQAYLDRGESKPAVFEFFVRKLPARRAFLMAAGLETALEFIATLRFTSEDIDWLKRSGRFRHNLLNYLADWRFTGDVHAMPEGTVFMYHAKDRHLMTPRSRTTGLTGGASGSPRSPAAPWTCSGSRTGAARYAGTCCCSPSGNRTPPKNGSSGTASSARQ